MTQRTGASTRSMVSSSTTNSHDTPAKTRRSHRKSRNGCIECKHRHIRCDERRPSCANCEAAERTCSFPLPRTGRQKHNQEHQNRAKQQQQSEVTVTLSPCPEAQSSTQLVDNADKEHTEQPLPPPHQQSNRSDLGQAIYQLSHRPLPTQYALLSVTSDDAQPHQIPSPAPPVQLGDTHKPPADCCPGLVVIPDVVPKALFIPQHMVLLHRAREVPNFIASNNRDAVDIAVRHAISSPYLIDEVLAFTAFHLAGLYPGSAVYLRRLATELQTRALTSFTRLTETVPHDDKATAVPRFLFSGILGRHVLADTLLYCRSDFNFFIDRFIECVNLNRGIRAVTPPAWDYLYNTEMRPFLSVTREAEEKIISPGNECDALKRLMDDSDLNEVSVNACRQAIVVLQWAFDICHHLDEDDYPQSASAFSVRIDAGFVDVLRKHRPEALVILAYYGVVLYRCRSFWAFSDAGASMIRAIAGQVGSYWQEALAWPLHVLETERGPSSQTPGI